MIKMSNINKGYMLGEEKLPILKDISFSVKKGEYVAILGPSGSGKTTLMNIIGCMDVMDSGEYYLDGMAIHSTDEEDLTDVRNNKIGFIFQNYQLIPTYNVMQNIVMPLLMRGMTYKEAEKECTEIIRLLGLEERVNHRRVNYPEVKNSVFLLQELWWENRRSFWQMSLPLLWTRAVVKMF